MDALLLERRKHVNKLTVVHRNLSCTFIMDGVAITFQIAGPIKKAKAPLP